MFAMGGVLGSIHRGWSRDEFFAIFANNDIHPEGFATKFGMDIIVVSLPFPASPPPAALLFEQNY